MVTFIFALYTAKITALLFLLRIANLKKTRILYYVCIAGTAVFGIASTLVVTIDCPTSSGYYWNFTGSQPQCQTQVCSEVLSSIALQADPRLVCQVAGYDYLGCSVGSYFAGFAGTPCLDLADANVKEVYDSCDILDQIPVSVSI